MVIAWYYNFCPSHIDLGLGQALSSGPRQVYELMLSKLAMLQAGQARWILGLDPRLGITNEAHLPWLLMVEPYWSVVDIPVRWPVGPR